jgi:uncharacterized protein (DUF2336 family)
MAGKTFIDGLADLPRTNDQTRDAVLIRAATDLFLQDDAHDRDELHRYEELAVHFLPKIPAGDRAYVAERLADCRDAPQAVVRMLARDAIAIAAPLLRRSVVLDALDIVSIIASTGVEHHRVIAARTRLSEQARRALRLTGDGEVLRRLAESEPGAPKATPVASERPPGAPGVGGGRDGNAFLELDRTARLGVLADFATRPVARPLAGSANRLDRAFRSILGAARIVGFARTGQRPQLIAAIAEGLDIDAALVDRCMADATGEGIAVLLKALRLDTVQAQQVFLLATPAGRDVATFFPLADLFAGMEPAVAETICEGWRATALGPTPAHQPYLADGERARREVQQVRRPAASGQGERAKRA